MQKLTKKNIFKNIITILEQIKKRKQLVFYAKIWQRHRTENIFAIHYVLSLMLKSFHAGQK